MRHALTALALFLLLAANGTARQAAPKPAPDAAPKPATEEVCVLRTNLGTMAFRFFAKDAPATVAYFKKLVREGFYDGKPFYRVVKGHVIQAGGGDDEANARPKVKGEFSSHPHVAGTVGLARDADPDSGSTEFYICLAPRPHLDGKYAVFGQLIEGMDVLAKIGDVEVDEQYVGGDAKIPFHKPKKPVIIEKATLEQRAVP
jgi:cyclophilin family peptidyl-prolyl cis-trans isomerase